MVEPSVAIRVVAPNPWAFGHTFEIAVQFDLCVALPLVDRLALLPRTLARQTARLAGYRAPSDQWHAPWPTWRRRDQQPVARHRLHCAASLLGFFEDVLYKVGGRSPIDCRRLIASTSRDPYFRLYAWTT
jgi:hypothetical protein